MARGLRLLVYDRTCLESGRPGLPGLTRCWQAGALLYRGLGRLDAWYGASSWADALGWLASHRPAEEIAEIQYWGHGKWGTVLVDRDPLDAALLLPPHRLAARLDAVRARLQPGALVWLRTCEAFGARAGHDFAMRLTDRLGVRVAGHTYIIAVQQSGLHGLHPGHRPDWAPDEGLKEGTPDEPRQAHDSSTAAPNTLHCLQGTIPAGWFA